MQPDFTQLYSQLGVQPDCDLEEFKRAYRRRIIELHPDKQGANARSPETQVLLRELISLYATASSFHRRHGRLPGGAPPRIPGAVSAEAAAPSPPRTAPPPAVGVLRPSSRRGAWLAVLLAALVLGLVVSRDSSTPTAGEQPAPGPVRLDPDAASIAARTDQIEIGMDMATVLAIQGEPMHVRDTEWHYGPSWLKFEDERLVDWYSSPLHRLKTATPKPDRHSVAEKLAVPR